MADESPTKDLGTALASLLGGIAAFFNIFDMSFFVSGSALVGACLYGLHLAKCLPRIDSPLAYIGLAIGCYIAGVLAFSLGRLIRRLMELLRSFQSKQIQSLLPQYLEVHKAVPEATVLSSLNQSLGIDSVQPTMWATLRQCPRCAPTVAFINRYWVMAATYDGLVVALVAWSVVLGSEAISRPGYLHGVEFWLAACLLALALPTVGRAKSYDSFQSLELVASYFVHVREHDGA